MNEREELLQAVLTHPADDFRRLAFADHLELVGESARAEFIRIQCELGPWETRLDPLNNDRLVELRKRETELLRVHANDWMRAVGLLLDATRIRGNVFSRGFVTNIAASWYAWMNYHEKLFWSPQQTVPKYIQVIADDARQAHYYVREAKIANWMYGHSNEGFIGRSRVDPVYWVGERRKPDLALSLRRRGFDVREVESLEGVDTVARPFVTTALPLETVRLSTMPQGRVYGSDSGALGEGDWFAADYHRFDRVKCFECGGGGFSCKMCGGSGITEHHSGSGVQHCPCAYDDDGHYQGRCLETCDSCHGRPVNLWECQAWPGLKFKMPV